MAQLAGEQTYRRRRKIDDFYPDGGPLRRELYPKHLQFFAAGVKHSERLAICGNRTGKTEGLGAYETSVHATGVYPAWWPGRRFAHPIRAWAAGKTAETTRDIVQEKLLGFGHSPPDNKGTGLIPGDLIIKTTPKSGGIGNAVDTVYVRHASGGTSTLGFKSYGKDRDSFEGTERDWVWLDEEPPKEVYDECLMRTMSTVPGYPGGSCIITFTPLEGDTQVVRAFLENDPAAPDGDPDKFFIQITWDDAPHVTEAERIKMRRKYLPSQLRARERGEPALGEGAIYPIDIDELLVPDMLIPAHWPRAFGLDVGKTAVVWGARNPDTDVIFLFREYYSEEYNVLMHATAIRGIDGRDAWIPGVADPAAGQSSQIDGQKIIDLYRAHGVDVIEAGHKLVESGLAQVWERMVTGRLKVFKSLTRWQSEFGRYHRREKETDLGLQSKIVKKFDHMMDACLTGETLVETKSGPVPIAELVGKSGLVLSRGGAFAHFCGARKTLENAQLVELTFADGSMVKCTLDHPFLTENGWVPAIGMEGESCYNGISQCIQRKEKLDGLAASLQSMLGIGIWSGMRLLCDPLVFRSSRAAGTASIRASDISAEAPFGFTGKFGKSSTNAECRRDSTFTTTIMTARIISRKILHLFEKATMSACTIWEQRSRFPRPLLSQPPSGMAPQRAWNGISSTTSKWAPRCTAPEDSNASSAKSGSPPQSEGITDSAPTTAEPSLAGRLVWMMSNAIASFASEILWQIATPRRGPARRNAKLLCVSARLASRADVYCLTVPGSQSFCLSNGAVVHNTRYMHTDGIARMIVKPPPAQRPIQVRTGVWS